MHAITRIILAAAGLASLAPELVSSLIGVGVGFAIMVLTRFVNVGKAPAESVALDDTQVAEALSNPDDDLAEAGEPKPQPL